MTRTVEVPETARFERVKRPFKIHHSPTLGNISAGQRAIFRRVASSWAATVPPLGHCPLEIGNRR